MNDEETIDRGTPGLEAIDPAADPDVADGGPIDPTRRQFFRRFAGEVVTSAATVVGAVTELRDRSAAEAAVLLGESPLRGWGSAAGASPTRVGSSFDSSGIGLDSGAAGPSVETVNTG
jgi:hypothetical protein